MSEYVTALIRPVAKAPDVIQQGVY